MSLYTSTAVTVQSKLGPVRLVVTDRDHIYASAGSSYDADASAGLVTRGNAYHASGHAYRADGFTCRAGEFYISRSGGRFNEAVSRPARVAIEAALSLACETFARENPEAPRMFAEAECRAAARALVDAREKHAAAEAAAAEALAVRVAAAKRLTDAAARFETPAAVRREVLAEAQS